MLLSEGISSPCLHVLVLCPDTRTGAVVCQLGYGAEVPEKQYCRTAPSLGIGKLHVLAHRKAWIAVARRRVSKNTVVEAWK